MKKFAPALAALLLARGRIARIMGGHSGFRKEIDQGRSLRRARVQIQTAEQL